MNKRAAAPVSWFSVAGVFIGLGLFLVLMHYTYKPRGASQPYNVAAETLPADQAWQATPDGRKAHLEDTRKKEAEQTAGYAWIDRDKGAVRLPVERAMELTVQDINARKR